MRASGGRDDANGTGKRRRDRFGGSDGMIDRRGRGTVGSEGRVKLGIERYSSGIKPMMNGSLCSRCDV